MPTPVVDQALEVTLPCVIILAAVRVPLKLALAVVIVPTIVPIILPPEILPDDNMLPPTLIPPAPIAKAYELVMAATFVPAAGASAMYTVAAVVTRVLAAVVAKVG